MLWGEERPPKGHLKPHRQLWGSLGAESDPIFDLVLRRQDHLWNPPHDVCQLCMNVRESQLLHCAGDDWDADTLMKKGRGGGEGVPHVLVMMPQNVGLPIPEKAAHSIV